MKIKNLTKRTLALGLALVLIFASAPVSARADVSFPDVKKGEWYYDYVTLCASYGIIDGYDDGLFHPDNLLKRGEFMKLVAYIGELPATTMAEKHWADPYWGALNDSGVLWGLDIGKSYEELEAPITRFEMCVMIKNLCFNIYCENAVSLSSPEKVIADYGSIDSKYKDSVVQAFGKGILDGYTDGTFRGNNTLTRSEAAAIVVRSAWPNQRKAVSSASEISSVTGSGLENPSDSFAFRYRSMTDYERRSVLFGDGNKTYFTGRESNLDNYIVTVEVNTWYLNEQTGVKSTKVRTLQVNRAVADEVKAIFEEIYNDPEQFPIKALGGARYTDTLRHSWGCAIDINPVENYYVNTTTWTALTGSYCYKQSDSPYCIRPGGSVVRAFTKYGWGWGGGTADNNYTGWNTTADYMHFSILSSGG